MDSLSNRLTGKVSVMSNKLRSFLIVVMSIVVVMAALPLNALRVYADGGEYEITYIANNGTDKEDTDYYTKGSSTEYTIKTIDDLGYMAPYGCEFDGWYTTAGIYSGPNFTNHLVSSVNDTVRSHVSSCSHSSSHGGGHSGGGFSGGGGGGGGGGSW